MNNSIAKTEVKNFSKGKVVYTIYPIHSGLFFKLADCKYKVIETCYALCLVSYDGQIVSIPVARVLNGDIATNEMVINSNDRLKNKTNINGYLRFLRVCCQKTASIERINVPGGYIPPQSDKELIIPDFNMRGSHFFVVPVDRLAEIEKNGEAKDSGELDFIILNHAGWVNSDEYAFSFSKEEEDVCYYDRAAGCKMKTNASKFIISYDKGSRRIRKITQKRIEDGKLIETQVSACYFRPFSSEKTLTVGKFLPQQIAKK